MVSSVIRFLFGAIVVHAMSGSQCTNELQCTNETVFKGIPSRVVHSGCGIRLFPSFLSQSEIQHLHAIVTESGWESTPGTGAGYDAPNYGAFDDLIRDDEVSMAMHTVVHCVTRFIAQVVLAIEDRIAKVTGIRPHRHEEGEGGVCCWTFTWSHCRCRLVHESDPQRQLGVRICVR